MGAHRPFVNLVNLFSSGVFSRTFALMPFSQPSAFAGSLIATHIYAQHAKIREPWNLTILESSAAHHRLDLVPLGAAIADIPAKLAKICRVENGPTNVLAVVL